MFPCESTIHAVTAIAGEQNEIFTSTLGHTEIKYLCPVSSPVHQSETPGLGFNTYLKKLWGIISINLNTLCVSILIPDYLLKFIVWLHAKLFGNHDYLLQFPHP